ncbi:hypothetical protein D3C76_941010 [compost metagenome]
MIKTPPRSKTSRPKVEMKGFNPTFTTIKPLNQPISPAMPRATNSPVQPGNSRPKPPIAAGTSATAATIGAKPTTPSSDRSRRPISTTKVRPIVVRPRTLICSRMFTKLVAVANLGATTAPTITSNRITGYIVYPSDTNELPKDAHLERCAVVLVESDWLTMSVLISHLPSAKPNL